MSLRCFTGMLEEVGTIMKMEMGGSEEKPLEGDAAFALAQRIFKRGRR